MRQLIYSVRKKILIVLPVLFFIISCQKPISWPDTGTNPVTPPITEIKVNDNETVIASVQGIVVNENNVPVQGATVKSGTKTTTTDRHGVFRFSNISLSKANGTVKVEHNGYFNAYRTFIYNSRTNS